MTLTRMSVSIDVDPHMTPERKAVLLGLLAQLVSELQKDLGTQP